MAKRFTDSRKWDDEWFLSLDLKNKLFWIYILDKCDHIGIYEPAISLASFCLGCSYLEDDILKVFCDRIIRLDCGKWFIPKFLHFQYGDLSAEGRLHGRIIGDLKVALPIEIYKKYVRVSSWCRQGVDTHKDKDKDKV